MKARQAAIAAALALILAAAFVSCAEPSFGDRVALVYGIADYQTVNDLAYTVDDAQSMADLLAAQGWGDVRLRLDAAAGKAAMLQDIADLGAQGFRGLLLLYFSGHGTFDSQGTFICPWDTVASDYGTMISPSELFAAQETAGLRHAVVILDSCFSGGFVSPGATVDAVPPAFGFDSVFTLSEYSLNYLNYADAIGDSLSGFVAYSTGPGAIVLSAAGSREESFEAEGLPFGGHGVFTYFLLNAPAWADIDRDGWIDTSELYRFTSANIQARWNDLTYFNDYHPHVSGSPREYAIFKATN